MSYDDWIVERLYPFVLINDVLPKILARGCTGKCSGLLSTTKVNNLRLVTLYECSTTSLHKLKRGLEHDMDWNVLRVMQRNPRNALLDCRFWHIIFFRSN